MLLAAGVLWLVGFVGAGAADCPESMSGRALSGLDAPRSLWPPGAECVGTAPAHGERTVAELIPGLGWATVALAFAGLAILATGLALEIHRLRSRSTPRASAPAAPNVRALAWPE